MPVQLAKASRVQSNVGGTQVGGSREVLDVAGLEGAAWELRDIDLRPILGKAGGLHTTQSASARQLTGYTCMRWAPLMQGPAIWVQRINMCASHHQVLDN